MRESLPLLDLMNRKSSLAKATRPPLQTVGLFAGIGGLELGLSRSGHETILLNEIDDAAKAVLKNRFPGTRLHADVTTLRYLPRNTELVVGGFPCQDLSQAGQTKGIGGSKSGLVGEVFRLVEHRRVPWLLLENVPFMLRLGRGKALNVIVSELERLGYKWAYRVVDSRSFGVPQRRQRVYLLASTEEDPRRVLFADETKEVGEPTLDKWRKVACGFYWTEGTRGLGWATDAVPTIKGGSTIGIPSPPAVVLPSGMVVKPDIRDAERLQGFQSDWTLPAEKVAKKGVRFRLVGNAVTVDAAQWLGERLRSPGDFDEDCGVKLPKGKPWPNAAWNVGDGRKAAPFSKWPLNVSRSPLTRFLRFDGTPLSERATRGFLSRAKASSLRFPPGFLELLDVHLEKMERTNA